MFHRCLSKVYMERKKTRADLFYSMISDASEGGDS